MAEEELSHEHQLDKIATQVNVHRVDGIVPESFLTPSFLKYFPVVIEPGVLTDVNWNNISGLFVWSPVLLMMYVDNEYSWPCPSNRSGRQMLVRATIHDAAW